MESISNSCIIESLGTYGFSADDAFCENVRSYLSLLVKWNRTISLTTVTDPRQIVNFHFGESIFAASSIAIKEGRLADVGSGAGFPGIPIAMAAGDLQATLIESNLKKCAFLSEVTRVIRSKNIKILRDRMGNLEPGSEKFDFITARALGKLDDLLTWSKDRLSASGSVVLWLGEEDAGRLLSKLGWDWRKPVLIPGSSRRYLLIGSPDR